MLARFGFGWRVTATSVALTMMSGPIMAKDASDPVITPIPAQLSLTCAVVDPKGEWGTISLAIDERTVPSIRIALSTLNLDNFVADEVTAIATESGGAIVRQFQVNAPLGPLALRLLRRGTDWGIEVAPVDWSILSGPLVTGRCSTGSEMPAGLKPLNTQELSYPSHAMVGMPPERWSWGAVEKKCRIVWADSMSQSVVAISAEGDLSYIDSDGTLFKAKLERPLISSESGHTTVYKNMILHNGGSELKFSFNYRQGRFWIDGLRSATSGEASWFRGVCISDLPN